MPRNEVSRTFLIYFKYLLIFIILVEFKQDLHCFVFKFIIKKLEIIREI